MQLLDHDLDSRPAGLARACPPTMSGRRYNYSMDGDELPVRPDTNAERLERVAGEYAQLRTLLLAFLRKLVGDPQVAEDLLHDVIVKALSASDNAANTPRNLTGWLYAVARNAAMDHHRRNRPTEELPEDLVAPDNDDEVAITELANCLRPMAEQLPATYRDTLIAAEFEGMALAEIATQQGLSLSAVKSRTSRGRRLLQQSLIDCCRVALSTHGEVLDYDASKVAGCAITGSSCKTN